MAYSINAVQQTADGKLNLRMYDPVTRDSFIAPLPTVQPNLPALVIVLTGKRRRTKRHAR